MSFENSGTPTVEQGNETWNNIAEILKQGIDGAMKTKRGALFALATVLALAPNEGSAQSADTPIESLSLEQNYTIGPDTYFEDQSLEASHQRALELAQVLGLDGVDSSNINMKLEGYVPVEINGQSTWDSLTDSEQNRVEYIREMGKIMSGGFSIEDSIEEIVPDKSDELSKEPGMVFESDGIDPNSF